MQTESPKAERKVFVPELNGSITFSDKGGMVDRKCDHWFIERNGRTDDEIINEAIDEVTASPKAGERTWFTIITDDGEEHKTLLDRGTKAEVFSALDEYEPSVVRVLEQNRDDEFAETIEAMNGEEWLRNAACPTCHRMDFDAVLEESLTSLIGIKCMEVRLLNAKEAKNLL